MSTTSTYLLLRAFVDELARCGLRHACTSPGSRSTPLVLSLVREEKIRCWSHIDERVAGFFALGLAKRSGVPAVIACTSGTAAAHYAPAVHEASQARVPLIVLTADRPPELRDVGAGQTIDQLKLYGDAVRAFVEVGVDDATPATLRWIRALACRAYWTALDDRPGPVHLNFPLREPLVLDEPLPDDRSGRPNGRPWVVRQPLPVNPAGQALAMRAALAASTRGVIVAGRYEREPAGDGRASALGAAASAFAARIGYPLLADPLSGARRGAAAVAHYDALLRDEAFIAEHEPDVVVRLGDLPTSKPLRTWLASLHHVPQIALDPDSAWQDPDAVVAESFPYEPASTLTALIDELEPRDDEWLAGWRDADALAAGALRAELADALSEPRVAAELGGALPAGATLVVASSMPVRDVETFFPVRDDGPLVLANRGANGIDGTLATAFGAAAGSDGPVVALVGDVALHHDLTALLANRRLGLAIVVVVLDNDGGGIFSFLPVSREADVFEEHVATPHGLDVAAAAALYGCDYAAPSDLEDFRAALGDALQAAATTVIHVRSDREQNLALHRRAWAAVQGALDAR